MISLLERQPPAPRPAERHGERELVLADAYDASLEVARELAPSLRGVDDVAWIERTIETLPMALLGAATGRSQRAHLEQAEVLAVRLRVAIEVLDGLGALGTHPTRIRARACGIQARLRDVSR